MDFEWDQEKNAANLAKHGIVFQDILPVFQDPDSLLIKDRRRDYGEDRFVLLGPFQNSVLHVVFTWREDHIRIISVRRASRRERRDYEQRQGRHH